MFYELVFDMDRIDETIEKGTNTIYAEATNIDEIEYPNVKKGWFDTIILSDQRIDDQSWPDVEFYYSSKASNLESEYLLNIKQWPIIHKMVQKELEKLFIGGLQFLPIKLVDVVTNEINDNYVVMNILNFIEAYDLDKSKYKYNKTYDYYTFLPHETYLNKTICGYYDIFRCAKSVSRIYVSEKIKRLIEDNRWIGFALLKQRIA